MPHPRSAAKRHRQSLRRRARNQARKSAVRTALRHTRELIAAGAREEAEAAIRAAASLLDRAARKGALHANTAARRKSRLMRRLHAVQAQPTGAAAPRRRRTRTTAEAAPPSEGAGSPAAPKTPGRSTRAKKS